MKVARTVLGGGKSGNIRNCRITYRNYLMIVKKDDQLIIPVMLNSNRKLDVRDAKCSLWRDVLAAVMETKRGSWSLPEIYGELEGRKKTINNANWQAKVRQTLQRHPDLFRHDGRGMWSLAAT